MYRGKYDIGPIDFSITKARSEVVDFLPSLDESYQKIFINNPLDSLNWNAYIEPVALGGWLAIIIFIVVVPPIMAGIMFYGKYLKRNVQLLYKPLSHIYSCSIPLRYLIAILLCWFMFQVMIIALMSMAWGVVIVLFQKRY